MATVRPSATIAAASAAHRSPILTWLAGFISLTKPGIMTLLLTTTLAALLIAERSHPLAAWDLLRITAATLLGGAFASGGAASLNSYIDRDIDAIMSRTKWRPIPSGLISPRHVLLFGLALSLLSFLVLIIWTTPAAALLAVLGNFYYVVIYTAWLKRRTTQNIVVGGIAGAIPPLVGWAAVTGSISIPALLLFLIIVLWTPAHFWALALITRRDYDAAHIPMLPVIVGEHRTKRQILLYTVLVVLSSLILVAMRVMGPVYLLSAVALDAVFVYNAVRLLLDSGVARARGAFIYSNIYLALLFGAMVVDRLLPWSVGSF